MPRADLCQKRQQSVDWPPLVTPASGRSAAAGPAPDSARAATTTPPPIIAPSTASPRGTQHDQHSPPPGARPRRERRDRRARPGNPHRHGRRRDVDGPALRQPLPEQQHRRARLREADHPRLRLAPHPGRRRVVEGGHADDVGIQAAQGRQVPRRLGLHRRGRGVLDRARRQDPRFARAVHDLHEGDQGGPDRRPAHDPLRHRDARPAAPERHQHDLHRLEEDRDRGDDRRLQLRQGDERHRPVQVRVVQARRPRRAGAQRRLLGPEARLDQGDVPHHPERPDARRGAALGRRRRDREHPDRPTSRRSRRTPPSRRPPRPRTASSSITSTSSAISRRSSSTSPASRSTRTRSRTCACARRSRRRSTATRSGTG